MFRRSISKGKGVRIILIDEKNDLQSQIAEYFAKQSCGGRYEVFSAGPSSDCVDCELISVMYQLGYDIRDYRSKDFNDEDLPKEYDLAVFLEKDTYERVKDNMPWNCRTSLQDFGRKENFDEATDDLELYECYKALIEKVRTWVEEDLPGLIER